MVQQQPQQVQNTSTSGLTLSSLYSSGQCLLSVLGSIGVILLFAGIPQLIYAPKINPGSLMTFLLGAILICLMVAGNAFIGYKYRQLVRSRRQDSRSRGSIHVSADDKPPSYEDLLEEDGLPPTYATVITEKPPRYEDLTTEVFNWSAISRVPDFQHIPITPTSSAPPTGGRTEETPIIVPLHKYLSQSFDESQKGSPNMKVAFVENFAYQTSVEDLRGANPSKESNSPISNIKAKPVLKHSKSSAAAMSRTQAGLSTSSSTPSFTATVNSSSIFLSSSSTSSSPTLPTLQFANEMEKKSNLNQGSKESSPESAKTLENSKSSEYDLQKSLSSRL